MQQEYAFGFFYCDVSDKRVWSPTMTIVCVAGLCRRVIRVFGDIPSVGWAWRRETTNEGFLVVRQYG